MNTTVMNKTAKFEIRRSTNSQYYWRFVAKNGEPLCTSETYTSKQNTINGIQSLAGSVATAEVQDLT